MFKGNIVFSVKEQNYQEESKSMKAILICISFFFLISIGNGPLWAEESESLLPDHTVLSFDNENVLSDDTVPSSDKEEVSSDTFVMPQIYSVSINMINSSDDSKKEDLLASIKTLLIGGREKEAAGRLGEFLGLERSNSKEYLGFYCKSALSSVEGDLNDRAEFLSWFLVGYRKNGVVMVSQEGIEKINASGKKRGEFWRNVGEGKVPSHKLERVYTANDVTYIPFSSGEIFILDIVGSAQGEATVWKILPGGMNKKTWISGKWEREITVRGDKLY